MTLVSLEIINKHIALIKFNDPKTLNKFSIALGNDFQSIVSSLVKRTGEGEVRSVVLTGEGKAFSAGGDFSFLRARQKENHEQNHSDMIDFYHRFLSIRRLPVPVLSALNEAAVGAGLCLACATDRRLVSSNAKLSFNFSRLGIHAGMAATHFLPSLVGHSRSVDLLASGRFFTPQQALEWGLVDEVVDNDSLLSRSIELAGEYASSSPIATRGMMHTLRERENEGLAEALEKEAAAQAICYASQDFENGLSAIMNKKNPQF